MTKRFNNVGSYLYDNDEPIGSYNDVKVRDDVTDLLNLLSEKNERLKAQLYCDEGICTICKHHYLEKGKTYEKYYISKCKKGHEECSKIDLKYCDDFELKESDVE